MSRSNKKWLEVCDYYKKVFYKPDLDTLRIVLASVCSHYLLNEPPVWLFVIGPSSAGKTTQMIEPLSSLKLVRLLDVINDKTFVNGYEDKASVVVNKKTNQKLAPNEGGLLFRLKGNDNGVKHGIFAFSDWSMFTSLKIEVRQNLQAQFRGIYDGHLSHEVGNNKTIKWDGKVTMIIAGTKETEFEMGNLSGLGDRFLKVRMKFVDGIDERIQMFNKAAGNMGKKGGIKENLEKMIYQLIEGDDFVKASAKVVNAHVNFPYLLEVASILRRSITRDKRNNKIVNIGETENNTRIASGAIQIARGSAMLVRQSEIGHTDMRLAMKTIIDNIPYDRWSIVRGLACTEDGVGTSFGFEHKLHGVFSPYAIELCIEELEHLGVVTVEDRRATTGQKYKKVRLDKKVLELMKKGFKTPKLRGVYLKEEFGSLLGITKPIRRKG